MPRFVILEHDAPILHWDLMLESGAVLRTWRLLEPPGSGRMVRAQPLGDHRPLYLDYEGPVSGGRGTVARWDGGTYILMCEESDRLELQVTGQKLRGHAVLQRDPAGQWYFVMGPLEG